MASAITMPKLSDTMTEGTLVKWLKNEGDAIESGDEVAEIETDKAVMPVQAFETGILLKIVVPAGGVAACKAPIGYIGEKGEKIDASAAPAPAKTEDKPEAKAAPAAAPAPAPAAPAPAPAKAAASDSRVKASPLAKKVAKELNVSLAGLAGSGPGGRVVKSDVVAAQGSGSGGGWGLYPAGPITKEGPIALTNMRKTIAKRLQESKQQIPHFYVEMEVDMGPAMQLREALNARLEKSATPVKLSFNDFVLKGVAEALRKTPSLNATFQGDTIYQYGSVQLAFGVAIPGGLITPVIKDAQTKNLAQISKEAKELAGRAKEGKLKPEEYTTGTITVSNLGMFGVDRFSAIVNPPQAAILAVGNIVKKPVLNAHDEIVVGHRMNLVLAADHRVVDGADGALFLKELKALLESPGLLLI